MRVSHTAARCRGLDPATPCVLSLSRLSTRPDASFDGMGLKFTLEMPHSMQVDMVYQPLMEVGLLNEGVLGTMYDTPRTLSQDPFECSISCCLR